MNHGTQNVLELCKINFYLNTQNNLLLSVIILTLIPVVHGISYLNEVYSAQCLESFAVIPGIILIVPILLPEQNKEVSEIVSSKTIPQWEIILIRFVMAVFYIGLLIYCFAVVMQILHCKFPFIKYVMGTLFSAVALGSIGLLASALMGNIIIGYLISICYLILDMYTQNKLLGKFTLSSMQLGSFTEKYWLLGLAVICLILTVLIKNIRKL